MSDQPPRLDDDETLALKLLAEAPEDGVLMLPCELDQALCELENWAFADIIEPAAGIPLASITPAGRDHFDRMKRTQ